MTEFDEDNIGPIDRVRNISRALFFLFIFLLGIKGLGNGFSLLGGDLLDNIFQAMEYPFLGLIVGVLTTSMVQSSSVTTSLIVGLVAAPVKPLPIANAIPMIMGANFGTSITNTIVALGHAGHKYEFKRAFAVSTCDDFFELCSLSLLLPLEIATGFLSKDSRVPRASARRDWWAGTKYDDQKPVRL